MSREGEQTPLVGGNADDSDNVPTGAPCAGFGSAIWALLVALEVMGVVVVVYTSYYADLSAKCPQDLYLWLLVLGFTYVPWLLTALFDYWVLCTNLLSAAQQQVLLHATMFLRCLVLVFKIVWDIVGAVWVLPIYFFEREFRLCGPSTSTSFWLLVGDTLGLLLLCSAIGGLGIRGAFKSVVYDPPEKEFWDAPASMWSREISRSQSHGSDGRPLHDGPTVCNASHIQVQTEAEALALRERILNGDSFAELAQQFSNCVSASNGGALGDFELGDMVPPFDQVRVARCCIFRCQCRHLLPCVSFCSGVCVSHFKDRI